MAKKAKKKHDSSIYQEIYDKLFSSSNAQTGALTVGGTSGGGSNQAVNQQSLQDSLQGIGQGLGGAIGIGGSVNVPGNLYQQYTPSYPGIPWQHQTLPGTSVEPPVNVRTDNNCVDCFKKNEVLALAQFIFHGNSLCKDCYKKQLKSSNQLTRILEEKLETSR